MTYEGQVYRPPSEAKSLILQVTVGCSHNKCTYCSMYKDKKFRIKSKEEIFQDIESLKDDFYTKAFLADGDAMLLKTEILVEIMRKIKEKMPNIKRIGIYAHINNIRSKTLEELKKLKEEGLNIVYIGIESGDDKVLKNVNKGVTSKEILVQLKKVRESGIKLSVMIISGLGGKELTTDHAINTAKLLNEINPNYLSLLTLMVDNKTKFYKDIVDKKIELLLPEEILLETKILLENLSLEKTIFRANHASNYLNLSGILNKDKELILQDINQVISGKDYKPEYFRGL